MSRRKSAPKSGRMHVTGSAFTISPALAHAPVVSTRPQDAMHCVDCGVEIRLRDRSGRRKHARPGQPAGMLCGACDDLRTGGPLP